MMDGGDQQEYTSEPSGWLSLLNRADTKLRIFE